MFKGTVNRAFEGCSREWSMELTANEAFDGTVNGALDGTVDGTFKGAFDGMAPLNGEVGN